MNVVFRIVWVIIIEDMSNVLDIFNRVSKNRDVSNQSSPVDVHWKQCLRMQVSIGLSASTNNSHIYPGPEMAFHNGPEVSSDMQLEQIEGIIIRLDKSARA